MAKGVCANGELDLTAFPTPIPWIGIYIAAATLVCSIFITRDFLHGLFHKKPFLPCKWFRMNALTLTLLQVATKIPGDLTASMPRAEDQLSKLTSTTLLCISLGFYMPSPGSMETSERYNNVVAFSVMVITVIVNVCIQMHTGSIFAFIPEHIIIIVCMSVLLLLMWSSAIAVKAHIDWSKYQYANQTSEGTSNVKDVQGLGYLLKKLHVLNYTGNPQSLFCESLHHHAFGLLCFLSFIVVLEATLRSVVFKTMRFCSGADDYKWSIPFVIVTQLLTIGLGTCSIIYRWYSFICHTDVNVLVAHQWLHDFVGGELEKVKLRTLSFWVCGKNISPVLQFPKDIIIELLIRTQIMLYGCNTWFIGLPIYGVKMFFGFIIAMFYSRQKDNDEIPEANSGHIDDDEEPEVSKEWAISSLQEYDIFNNWILGMAMKEYKRWTKKYNEKWTKQKTDDERINCQTPPENPIIPFISKWNASKSECFVLGGILERLCGRDYPGFNSEGYKVSCLSVLILSRMLIELMPSSSSTRWSEFVEESSKALSESFEIIYYVDHKTVGDQKGLYSFLVGTQTRLSLTKNVWANWKNPKHWFHEIISDTCKLPKNSENSSNYSDQLHHAFEVLKHARDHALPKYDANRFKNDRPLIFGQKMLTLLEVSLLCKFILKKKHESIEDLIDFLEMSFVKMLRLILSGLPKAILKEIQGDYPYGICEGNVREAFKFFCALKSLGNEIEWSWEEESLSTSQENDVKSFVDAPDSGSEDEAEAPSIGADHIQVGNPTERV